MFVADGLGRRSGRRIDRRVGWLFGGATRRTNPPGGWSAYRCGYASTIDERSGRL